MTIIKFYNDGFYDVVKQILQEADLFDEAWETRQNLKRKIERDSQSILVAEEKGEIVGCIFIMEDGWNAFLWRLAVNESHRKKGIGLQLVKKAEEIIKERGITEVSLLVDPKNEELKQWYLKQNYIKARDWTFMYKKLK